MADEGLGVALELEENRGLLTGESPYTDDIPLPDPVHLAMVRSRFAHATIEDIDVSAATGADGVLDVYTAADVAASDIPAAYPSPRPVPGPDGPDSPITVRRELSSPDRSMLPADRVRYAGEPVAVVVAEDRYTAHAAASEVEVSYDRLDAVTNPVEAAADDAPTVHDSVPDNVAFDWESGDEAATDRAFADADHTVAVSLDHQRVIPNAVEPRAVAATWDSTADYLTVWRPSQGTHSQERDLGKMLGLADDEFEVRKPEVGGSFGNKSKKYPAEFAAAWVAYHREEAVSWQATRSEMYASGAHGRAHETEAQLAFDESGEFRGMRAHSHADMGAFVLGPAPSIHTTSFSSVLSGQYSIPAMYCRVTGCFTTTAPISSYRSTSRPIAIQAVERLVRKAARRLDVDPVALRRQNFIPPDAFPYDTPFSPTYDSGDYEKTMSRALEMVGYDEFRERQERLRDEGRYLGIGVCCSLDESGSGGRDDCKVTVGESGDITAYSGTSDTGQGHRTTYGQLLVEEFGVGLEDVELIQGDTDELENGAGSYGSRSTVDTVQMFADCATEILERGTDIAADELEAAPEDVTYEEGAFHVRGAPDRSVTLSEVASSAGGLEAETSKPDVATFPFGTHFVTVEVHPGSGEVDLLRYVAVDDCGTQVNPAVVENQLVGGIAQGLGEALFEEAVYDDTGTLQTGSLQDYALPRSITTPDFEVDSTVTPSPRTVHGVKGIAESGPVAPPPAVVNAVVDALEPLGVTDVSIPVTPERVWETVRDAT